jgi:(p)ppGpp synthase/HD superfamily hydrolase
VDGVSKLTKLDFFSAEERQAESFRKMLLDENPLRRRKGRA